MLTNHRRRPASIALVAILAAGGIVAGTALSQGASSTRNSAQLSASSAGSQPTSVSSELQQNFAVVRNAPAGDALPLPTNVASQLGDPTDATASEFGLDTAAARYVAVSSTFAVWVVPGTKGICIIKAHSASPAGASIVCDSVASADAGTMRGMVIPPAGSGTVFGILPDTNTTVTVTARDGTSQQIPVVDNIYAVPAGDAQALLVRNAAGGELSLALPSAN